MKLVWSKGVHSLYPSCWSPPHWKERGLENASSVRMCTCACTFAGVPVDEAGKSWFAISTEKTSSLLFFLTKKTNINFPLASMHVNTFVGFFLC